MADYAVTIKLPDHHLNDEWIGLSIGPVTVTGITQGTLQRIRMAFVKEATFYRLDSDVTKPHNATIVLDNTTTWTAHVSPVAAFLTSAGEWAWDMEFYHTGNVSPVTLYKGVLTVHPDFTR